MDKCRLFPIEICIDRLFMYDWYDGITHCIALDGEDSVYVIKRIQEVDVFERTLCFLYTYDVRVLDDPSLVELIKANSQPNEYVNLYGSGPWYEPILESEAFREEHWLAFGINLGTRTIYRVENCSGRSGLNVRRFTDKLVFRRSEVLFEWSLDSATPATSAYPVHASGSALPSC